jgi:hypothetical protein
MPSLHLDYRILAQSYCSSDDCPQDSRTTYSSSQATFLLAVAKGQQSAAHEEKMQGGSGGLKPRRVWRLVVLLQLARQDVCHLVLELPLRR